MPSTWRALVEADLLPAIASEQVEAYREQLLLEGQTDPLAPIISQVTKQVREAIRSNPNNVLHDDGTYLPEGAVWHSVVLVRHRLASRLEDKLPESWESDHREALSWLRDVRRGVVAIENPNEGEAAAGPSPSPRYSARTRRFSRSNQDGI